MDLIRSATSGNDWGRRELAAYNIIITPQDAVSFFDVSQLPEPHIPVELLDKLESEDIENLDACCTIAAMDLAMSPVPAEESGVDDFVVRIFDLLGYTTRQLSLRTRKEIELVICGKSKYAKTDVCLLMNRTQIILLVQEDKRQMEERGDAEAQLIAEAIAAFQSNNKKRVLAGLPPIDECLIPGIVMIGTAPVFYKMPITKMLADAVTFGIYPSTPTNVSFHLPAVPRPFRRVSEGMKPLDNRRIILCCYEAFKKFIVPQYVRYLPCRPSNCTDCVLKR